ncbi:MAG: sensor domain-containing diguanylate cyclase, partial [Marinobacter sp.]
FQQTIINNANVWLNVSDPEGYIMLWNRAAERISGYSEEEVAGSRAIWRKLYPDPDYRARVTAQVQEALSQGQEVMGLETRIQTRWGGERLIAWNARGFTDSHGSLAGSIVIGTDITERKAVEDALRERERQLATLMDSLPGMAYRCLYNEFWTMKFVSSGCWELTGYRPEELIENRRVAWSELVVPDDSGDVLSKVEEAIANGVSFSLEYRLRRADGEVIWVWERGRGGEDDDGMLLEGIILDITERKRLEERLSELATLDSLTGQLNRREAERMLQEEVVRAGRYDRQLAVLWVDLDHFKEVNDTWGHAAGDRVLRAVSLRLADSIRTVDTLGRYGGEEFLVVIPEASVDEARETAERLRQRVAEEPVTITGDQSLSMTISIGVAVYPDHGTSAEELCNRADKAMYLAKERGRNQVAIFNELPGQQSSG